MRVVEKLSLVVLAVAWVACPGQQTGVLEVSVTGLPDGTAAAVTVTGPDGYNQPLTGSTDITGLAPGNYTVTAAPARETGAVIDLLHDPAPSAVSVDVEANATTTVTVAHTLRPGTGYLWAPGPRDGRIYAFAPASLQDAGTADPAITLDVQLDGGALEGPALLAVDRQGTLVAGVNAAGDTDTEGIAIFPAASLAASGTVTPSRFIEPADAGDGYLSISYPEGIGFDPAGNLWLANCGDNGSLTRFTPDDLATSGAKLGRVWKTGTVSSGPALTCPNGVAFDDAGTMWIANCGGESGIYGYTAAQLASETAPEPAYALPNPSDLGCPENLAFDSEGNLWIAVCGSFQGVAAYTAAQLAVSGAGTEQEPQIRVSGSPMQCSTGLGFDNRGFLWVTNATGGGIMCGLTTDHLAASGDVTPLNTFPIPGVDYSGVAFNPPPVNLPIYR